MSIRMHLTSRINQSLTLLLILNIAVSHGYHILMVHDMGTKSHLLQLYPIVEKLLDQGHEVTSIFYASAKIQHENYTEVLVPNMADAFKDMGDKVMKKGGQSLINFQLWKDAITLYSEVVDDMALSTYNNEVSKYIEKNFLEIMFYLNFRMFKACSRQRKRLMLYLHCHGLEHSWQR